jgi:glycosyltransferase involved in cell wall biosynthesis
MRITFVAPSSHFSGGVKVIAIQAERLAKRGHEVVVVSPERRVPSLKDRVRSVLRGEPWFRPSEPSHFTGRSSIDLRIYRPHRPVEDRDVPDADVIISTWFETALWIDKLSPAKGAKVIFIQGYEALPEEPRPDIDEAWRLPFQKIVVARWLQVLAEERFGDAHAALVPNSVDTGQFFAAPRGMQRVPTVGFLSAQSPFKGLKTTLGAVAKIREKIPNLRLVSFGHESTHGDLALPADSEFHLLPPQDAIRDLYAKCDLWLCGNLREGFLLPVLEAMACRCPVVSTRSGGPEDIIVPGENGYLVDKGDAQGLAEAALGLLTGGEEAWKRFSDAAFARATRYTWDDAAALFETALQTAVARAARGEIRGGGNSLAAPVRDLSS